MGSKEDALEPEERERLFHACETPDEKVVIFCLAWLGLRVGELVQLRASWISFQHAQIRIPPQQGEWKPKSPAAARTIPFGWLPDRGDLIKSYFIVHDRLPFESVMTVRRWVHRIADRAKIGQRVYPHSLRATAAMCLAERGISAQGLRNLFGWKNLETAESYVRRGGWGVQQELERIMERR